MNVRKTISTLVLVSMTLHGMNTLGVVSYVYTHRHDLAYTLGITAEKMIAMCQGDYYQNTTLHVQTESDRDLPSLVTAHEITLSVPPEIVNPPRVPVMTIGRGEVSYSSREYYPPYSEFFHPPDRF